MDYNIMIQNNKVEFGQMPQETFLTGLLSAFGNFKRLRTLFLVR